MLNPFLTSPGPRFVDHDEVLEIARATARRIASEHAHVLKILLFGSFARGDFGVRSDIDLLVILEQSEKPVRERLPDFLDCLSAYPTDILAYTREEVESKVAEGDPFFLRLFREGIVLHPP